MGAPVLPATTLINLWKLIRLKKGSKFENPQWFQNGLKIGNFSKALGGGDYNGDGLQ
jgi:hypothetical protein